jgi:hypothetical protein
MLLYLQIIIKSSQEVGDKKRKSRRRKPGKETKAQA